MLQQADSRWTFVPKIPINMTKMNPLLRAYGRVKSRAARAIGKMYERQNSSGMDFAKEDGVWYAQVKGWPGPKAMCAMVDGADTFLDHLSGNGDRVRVLLSRSPQAGYAPLTYLAPHPAGDGAYYTVDLNGAEHRMWLCGVTEFVFGAMPDRIYYRTAE